MAWRPNYKLYASNGSTLIYTFNYITNDNGPQDPIKQAEIEGIRGIGSIIVSGSQAAWDLNLEFILVGTDYQDLIAKMDTLQTTIVPNTPYVLKIDRTISTTVNYNVKRILPIEWRQGRRITTQKGNIVFRVNSW